MVESKVFNDQLLIATLDVLKKYGLQSWFKNIPEGREYANDVLCYLRDTKPKDSVILELGCGIAQNLAVLSNMGFRSLFGVEMDCPTYRGAVDLCKQLGVKAKLICGNAVDVSFHKERFDIIMPLNWTYQEEMVNLKDFLHGLYFQLRYGGEIIIDFIDDTYPEDQGKEYAIRYNEKQIEAMVEPAFKITKKSHYFPRTVYHLEKVL